MGHPHLTPGRRLLRFLMDGGGSRTVFEISRRNADGQLLSRARPELDGLIVEEIGRSARTKRPIRRIALTLKGWAVALAFRPDWQPKRLATPILKAWMAELQLEQDPWACQFIEFEKKAAKLARLTQGGWIRRPRKSWVDKKKAKLSALGKFGEYCVYEPASEYVEERDQLANINRPPKPKMRPRGRPFPRTNPAPASGSKPAFTPRSIPITPPEPTSAWERNLQQGREHDAERIRIMQQAGKEEEARAEEKKRADEQRAAEKARLSKNCLICSAGKLLGETAYPDHDCSRFQEA